MGHWKLDEKRGTTASDSSNTSNVGTLTGGLTFEANATPGPMKGALSFENNHYIDLPDTFDDDMTDFSYAAWIYWKGNGTWERLFDFGSGRQQTMFLTPRSSAGTIRFAITLDGPGGEQQVNSGSALPSKRWVHVALTVGGSNAKLYVDGKLDSSSSNINHDLRDLNAFNNWIGRSQYPDPYFSGQMDDIRMYNRELSDREVLILAARRGR